jgi:predicted N-acyltransferase
VGEGEQSDAIRIRLIEQLKQLLIQNEISSAHILFAEEETQGLLLKQGFMARDAVQFHWKNHAYQSIYIFLLNNQFELLSRVLYRWGCA